MRVPAIGIGVLPVILASGIGFWVLAAQAMPASITAPGAYAESGRIGHSPQFLLASHRCRSSDLDYCRVRYRGCLATRRSTEAECTDRFWACMDRRDPRIPSCGYRDHEYTYQQPGETQHVPVRRPDQSPSTTPFIPAPIGVPVPQYQTDKPKQPYTGPPRPTVQPK